MSKKKKAGKSVLEEQDRIVSQNFFTAANSISQLYASAQIQHRLLFQAGEQHALEKLQQWILARVGEGSLVNEADVIAYLQNELGYDGEDPSAPPTPHSQQASNTNTHTLIPAPTVAMPQGAEQTKMFEFPITLPSPAMVNKMFELPSNLPSPAMGSLQPFHTAQGGFCGSGDNPQGSQMMPAGNNFLPRAFTRLDLPTQEPILSDSVDSTMDMHTDDDDDDVENLQRRN